MNKHETFDILMALKEWISKYPELQVTPFILPNAGYNIWHKIGDQIPLVTYYSPGFPQHGLWYRVGRRSDWQCLTSITIEHPDFFKELDRAISLISGG